MPLSPANVNPLSPAPKLTDIVAVTPAGANNVTALSVPVHVPYAPAAKQIVCPPDAAATTEPNDAGVADRSHRVAA
jgi:hypothetical protein